MAISNNINKNMNNSNNIFNNNKFTKLDKLYPID